MLEDVYLENSMIPKRYLKEIKLDASSRDLKTFEELNNIKNDIKNFVDRGDNLLICSNNVGNGKTSWATKLMKEYIKVVSNRSFENNTPALFINVNSFLNEKKLSISDPTLSDKIKKMEKAILSAKLVVFDDMANKNLSEYDMDVMYYWLDYRTSNLKSCIFTTNQLPEQLRKTLSARVYSRVVNYSHIKLITDGDHRKAGE